jgi:hypothetical protein
MTHGTATGYRWHGCRCAPCRDANTATVREQRRKKNPPVPFIIYNADLLFRSRP